MASSPDNAAIAEQLEAFAALLDLSGASFYTSRAYRRAAETIRETKAPVAELVLSGRIQELRGIGPGIAGRLRELVETGHIAELDELKEEVRPELVGLGRFLGIGPKRMVEIGRALGVSTPEEFREAARAGRLTSVSGIGPQTERRLLERLSDERAPQRKGMTLNRARALLEEIAASLDGEVAGDPRRWADTSFEFAIVCAMTAFLDPAVFPGFGLPGHLPAGCERRRRGDGLVRAALRRRRARGDRRALGSRGPVSPARRVGLTAIARGRRAARARGGPGLGGDAEHVAGLGFDTIAFDISPTAIRLARERHPESRVTYAVADLFAAPPEWAGLDLVVENSPSGAAGGRPPAGDPRHRRHRLAGRDAARARRRPRTLGAR